MKRRLLSAFLAVMMVLTMAPVAFAADTEPTTEPTTEYVAQVDGNNYATIADAIAAANNKTLTLLKDVNGQIVIPEGKKITLDLNGHTISNSRTAVLNNGNLTICDSSEKKSGVIKSTGNVGIGVGDNSYTTIEYANIQSQEGAVITSYSTGATIIIEDGVFSAADNSVVAGNGSDRDGDANKITINGGIFNGKIQSSGYVACGIYAPWRDDITVNGGTFNIEKGAGIVARAGNVTVNGGEFNTTGNVTGKVGDSRVVVPCAALVFDSEANYPAMNDASKIEVKTGKFKSDVAAVTVIKQESDAGNRVEVSGGTFSSDVSAYVAEGYVQNKNGTVEQLGETNAVAKVGNTYYKTLAEAVSAADNNTVTLLKNVVLNSTLTLNKNMTLDLNGCEISNGSTMGTDYLVSIAANADVSIVGNKENSKISDSRSNAQGTITAVVVYGKLTVAGDNLTISRGANGIAIKVEDNPGTLIVNGGTITVDKPTQTSSQAIQNWGNATINGGVFNGDVDSYAYIAANKNYVGNMTIENGIFNGEVFAAQLQYNNQWPTASARVAITGGNFKGIIAEYYHDSTKGLQPVENVSKPANTAESEVVVSGGYFTTDPTNYVASGYVAGTSDVSGYSYKVVAKTNTGNVEVKPAVSDPEVKVSESISKEDKAKVEEAAKTVSAPTLGAAAVDEAQKINADKANELLKDVNVGNGDKKLYVQSSLKVEPTAYDAENKTLALEITPQYRVVASTADTADKIKLDGNTKNAQVVQDYQNMTIDTPTEVTMELPTGFAVADGAKLSIKHTKSNGTVEYYTGTVTKKDDKLYLTFTTNGFSPFVISVPAASIGENVYPTLQAAADAAKSTDVISVKSGASHELNFTTTKSVKVKNDTGVAITVKFNGTNKDVAKDATETFSYTKPSSSSSGGSSSGKTTYKVTTSAVNNGGVNASPSNAEKGATITLTLSPDKGYKLDKLTVTDGSGKSVSTVKKSDTVYTFTMPASTVTVGVSYAKADETPSKTTFNDVSANDWFASAVDYVTGKGMMNGTAANTFSPKANTTRGMLMTVLARHAGEDTTGGSVWYEKGMNWAKANGVSDGTNPQVNITREQLAAMLYRYAQNKKYDVSVGEDTNILSYTDAQTISQYAIPAIQWACGAGVMNGKSGSKLDPKGYATRAEVAAMLMRFCENVEK